MVDGAMTENLAVFTDEIEDKLPPFRSAREFPVAPKDGKLHELYVSCRKALVDSNSARSLLRKRMNKKKEVIAAIRAEIERVENDLAIEAGTRIQLHAMNEQLIGVLRDMEEIADDISITVTKAHAGRRAGLNTLIEKIKKLIRAWREFKIHQRSGIAKTSLGRHHDDTCS